jgi:Domain of unknown function (DUF4383)
MAHIPVNHPARFVYRTFAGLIGLYILTFGILGTIETWGTPLFGRGSHWVLALRTNLAFSLVSIVFGAVVVFGALQRSNLGHYMNLAIGVIFLVTAILMLALLQTEANFLNFSVSTVVVSMIFGLLVMAAGLYGKVGPHPRSRARRAPQQTRVPESDRR